MTKELHIFRGIPGSGKTTAAQALIDERLEERFVRAYLIDEDDFFTDDWRIEQYRFHPALREVAHDYAFSRAIRCLHHGYYDLVVVAGVFPKRGDIQRYIDTIWNANLDVKIIIHDMDGGFKSIHGVPESQMELFRMAFESWPK